jgi:hypothetical protein
MATKCVICRRDLATDIPLIAGACGIVIECVRCGRYACADTSAMAHTEALGSEVKDPLSCAARQASESGHPLTITTTNAAELAEPHATARVSDNVDKLLRLIAARSRRPGGEAQFDVGADFTLIDCYSAAEFDSYLRWMRGALLVVERRSLPTVEMALTMEGWNRVQPLSRRGGIPGQCFVAMSFSAELQGAYEQGIEPAVRKAGFNPLRIDRKEHNNDITDEIMAGIRDAEFIVADFTDQRPGVYYEAGFAMGLGRTVIWCCQKDQIRQLHFDTNHRNHIAWKTPQELCERLYSRIRATVLEQG